MRMELVPAVSPAPPPATKATTRFPCTSAQPDVKNACKILPQCSPILVKYGTNERLTRSYLAFIRHTTATRLQPAHLILYRQPCANQRQPNFPHTLPPRPAIPANSIAFEAARLMAACGVRACAAQWQGPARM